MLTVPGDTLTSEADPVQTSRWLPLRRRAQAAGGACWLWLVLTVFLPRQTEVMRRRTIPMQRDYFVIEIHSRFLEVTIGDSSDID